MNRSNGETPHGPRDLMVFTVGAQEFCVDIMKVREIRMWTPATPVAHAPPYMCGVVNLRGAVLPIIDLAARLGLRPTLPTKRHAIMVVETGSEAMGALVDGVSEILGIDRDAIQPAPDVSSEKALHFVSGIVVMEGRLITLLSLDTVLPAVRMEDSA